jgi:hypothetical protein
MCAPCADMTHFLHGPQSAYRGCYSAISTSLTIHLVLLQRLKARLPNQRRRRHCRQPPTLSLLRLPATLPLHVMGHRYPSPTKRAYSPPPVSQSAYMTPPTTPDSPSPSYSASTSPASSASPPTPPGIEDLSAKIVSALSPPGMTKHEPILLAILTTKSNMFAVASPSIW